MTRSASGLAIFDVDGTLFQTETATIPAIRFVFAEHGLAPPSEAEVRQFYGKPDEAFLAWLEGRVPGGRAAGIAAAVWERELEMVPKTGRLYPGARECLGELRCAVREMAICSNGPEVYVRTVLEAHDLPPFFDHVRWRGEEDAGKAEMVADLLGRLRSRPALVVGDREDDVAAARANGILVIGAAYGYGGTGELEGADALVDSVSELPRAVRRLMGADEV